MGNTSSKIKANRKPPEGIPTHINDPKIIQRNNKEITGRKTAERALLESEKKRTEQNTSYNDLNNEYVSLNEELTKSIDWIQHITNALIIATHKAEESDQLKSAFLSNMSHEIRTPMNTIVGFSELILNHGLPKERLIEYVQIIKSSTLQLLSIITDIVDISKIEAGKFSTQLELVNIYELLDELLVTYKKAIGSKKLKLHLSANHPGTPILIQTDGTRIKQVLCNLLNNAIKFTKAGEIEFGYELKGDFVEFYVKDNGIGIAPENLLSIFESFKQIPAVYGQLISGNGLGLAISKALIEKLGGSIYVDSELGKGSKFTFTIPYTYDSSMNI